jgi:hypothetical protein
MTKKSVAQPHPRQLAKLLRLLGPEEGWDDAAAALVLELHGIDPAESEVRLRRLVDKIIREKTDCGEEVLESLRELQSRIKAS